MDVRTNSKALYRLRLTCERVKKILSANSQAPVNVECLMNDKDVSSMIDRPGFEALVEPLLNRIEGPVLRALEAAGITKDQVDAVEIVGGTTRIPAVKQRIGVLFGKDVSTTLNQDECVAKGCTLMVRFFISNTLLFLIQCMCLIGFYSAPSLVQYSK